jgi:Prohead core protein serine protease
MKLITESLDAQTLIVEEAGAKEYYIEGPFLQAEIKNRNGRVYPLELLQREVMRYTKEFISENRALGELGHPDGPQINLDRVSHRIVEMAQSGRDFNGKAKILDTPNGRIVKALIDDGVKLGVSSRGLGSLKSTSEGDIVGEDFYLATAADIVADPSAPNAFVRGIMEGKEWVWQNGALTEAQIAQYKKEIDDAPKHRPAEKKLVEAAAFEHFLRSIRLSVENHRNTK